MCYRQVWRRNQSNTYTCIPGILRANFFSIIGIVILLFTGILYSQAGEGPDFRDVSVHDPSVIDDNGTYYVFGSHLASARTDDLIQWEQVSTHVHDGNPLIPNVYEELSETFDWAETSTLWAPDVVKMNDGRYYMYYCACEGSSPLSALGVAVSDNIEGPYEKIDILLKSGMSGVSEDGTNYNVMIHPNAVDPQTFFDTEGTLWMVYGSYSGGIFMMEMDPETGLQYPDQGYGDRIMGGDCAVEGAFIIYSPVTEYYYLFISFGGLSSDGGYNIRIARSRNPDGPYYDPQGQDMINCQGGGIGNHDIIKNYGGKMCGNFQWVDQDRNILNGYVSPGHNSVLYDSETGRYFNIFHTRFPGAGEGHQVRVHEMFMNQEEWLVMAPRRYAGVDAHDFSGESITGEYAFVNHGRDVSASIKTAEIISLNSDNTITGDLTGEWQRPTDSDIDITIDGTVYSGVLVKQWDENLQEYVMAFTAMSSEYGTCIWGSQVSSEPVEDCAGVMGGLAYIDNCGECVGGTTGNEPCVQDCNGDWGGDAYTDECGVCVAGATGVNPCTGSVQGEDATDFDGVIEGDNEGYTEEGYLNYANELASSAEWRICSDTAFTSALTIRYSNGGGANRDLAVSVNGEEQISRLDIPATSSWTEWETVTAEVAFPEGKNQITLTALSDEGGPNIDVIAFSDPNLYECNTGINTGVSDRLFKHCITYRGGSFVSIYLRSEGDVSLNLYDMSGQRLKRVYEGRAEEGKNLIKFNPVELRSGMYILVLETENRVVKRKVLRVQ